MVLGYNYSKQKRRWWRTNVPLSPAILIAMVVRRSNTDGVARYGISRATPEATGHRHQVNTRSVLPLRLPGQQANKQQSTNTPTELAILMAMAVCRYNTESIAQWRRSRALVEATGCCHWLSIAADRCNRSRICRFFDFFHRKLVEKGHRSRLRPLFSIGVWYFKQKRRAWLRWVFNLMGWPYW